MPLPSEPLVRGGSSSGGCRSSAESRRVLLRFLQQQQQQQQQQQHQQSQFRAFHILHQGGSKLPHLPHHQLQMLLEHLKSKAHRCRDRTEAQLRFQSQSLHLLKQRSEVQQARLEQLSEGHTSPTEVAQPVNPIHQEVKNALNAARVSPQNAPGAVDHGTAIVAKTAANVDGMPSCPASVAQHQAKLRTSRRWKAKEIAVLSKIFATLQRLCPSARLAAIKEHLTPEERLRLESFALLAFGRQQPQHEHEHEQHQRKQQQQQQHQLQDDPLSRSDCSAVASPLALTAGSPHQDPDLVAAAPTQRSTSLPPAEEIAKEVASEHNLSGPDGGSRQSPGVPPGLPPVSPLQPLPTSTAANESMLFATAHSRPQTDPGPANRRECDDEEEEDEERNSQKREGFCVWEQTEENQREAETNELRKLKSESERKAIHKRKICRMSARRSERPLQKRSASSTQEQVNSRNIAFKRHGLHQANLVFRSFCITSSEVRDIAVAKSALNVFLNIRDAVLERLKVDKVGTENLGKTDSSLLGPGTDQSVATGVSLEVPEEVENAKAFSSAVRQSIPEVLSWHGTTMEALGMRFHVTFSARSWIRVALHTPTSKDLESVLAVRERLAPFIDGNQKRLSPLEVDRWWAGLKETYLQVMEAHGHTRSRAVERLDALESATEPARTLALERWNRKQMAAEDASRHQSWRVRQRFRPEKSRAHLESEGKSQVSSRTTKKGCVRGLRGAKSAGGKTLRGGVGGGMKGGVGGVGRGGGVRPQFKSKKTKLQHRQERAALKRLLRLLRRWRCLLQPPVQRTN